jgi:hypothetical protein
MSKTDIAKAIAALAAVAFLTLGAWLVLSGRIGPMKELEARNERERIQRQINETQRQQNLRRPFEAVGLP